MRCSWVLIGLIFGVGSLAAAPLPRAATPAPFPGARARAAEARRFARQLLVITGQVADQYVRPVSREELLLAALSGLYDGARRRAPADLGARLREAGARSGRVVVNELPPPGTVLPNPDLPLAAVIAQAYQDVAGSEALQGQNPLLVCCEGMTRVLDPHSGVVTAEEQRRAIGLDAECYGVGLDLSDNEGNGPLLVKAVQPGGPAQRAGIRPGDEVTHVDGRPVRSHGRAGVLLLLNRRPTFGAPPVVDTMPAEGAPRPVHLTIRRNQKAERRVTLNPERFRPETVLGIARHDDNSWDYMADRRRRLAQVRVAALGKGTADELAGVLAGLKEEGVRGVVLDLRWCPGGFLNEAVDTAGLFLGAETVATVKARGREDKVCRGSGEDTFDLPVVVLVNESTSGGAELVAASLQDHHRAVVVGQRTLGKASVQTPLTLGVMGVGLKLTTGTFIRPSGKNLHRFPGSKESDDWGVRPDAGAEFRVSGELSKQLSRWWLEQTLRPGQSNERLPLDDPGADPQRQAALEVLAEQLDRQERAQAGR